MATRNIIVQLPLGTTGLHGGENSAILPPTALQIAEGITFESGAIRKEGGAKKLNTTSLAAEILGGHYFDHDGFTPRHIVFLSDGTIKKLDDAGNVLATLATGLTTTDSLPIFVEGGKEGAALSRKLFIFSGKNQVKVLSADGATVSNINLPPLDWASSFPTFGLLHENRLVGAGNANDPHRLYFSTTTNHEDFTGAGSLNLPVYPGDGVALVGAVSVQGGMLCFKKPYGVYYVDTSDVNTNNWKVRKISSDFGCADVRAYINIGQGILVVDAQFRIYLITPTEIVGSYSFQEITRENQIDNYIRQNLSTSLPGKTQVILYRKKAEVHIFSPLPGSTKNNHRLTIDFLSGSPRFRTSQRDTASSAWIKTSSTGETLFIGDDVGFIWALDQQSRDKGGIGYDSKFRTVDFDLSHIDPALSAKRKLGQFIEIAFEVIGQVDVDIELLWDGKSEGVFSFSSNASSAALGSFVLGVDKLSSTETVNLKRRITGSGKRVGFLFSNNSAFQDFIISGIYLHFVPGDER